MRSLLVKKSLFFFSLIRSHFGNKIVHVDYSTLQCYLHLNCMLGNPFRYFNIFFPVSNQKVHLQHVYEPEVLLFFHADQQQSCSYKRLALPS